MTKTPANKGTLVRLTNNKGEIFAAPETAAITPATGERERPVLDTRSRGAKRKAGLMPNCAANCGANSTKAKKAALPEPAATLTIVKDFTVLIHFAVLSITLAA